MGTRKATDRRRGATMVLAGLAVVAIATAGATYGGKKVTLTITGKIEAAETRNGKISAVFITDAERGEFIVLRGTDVAKKLTSQVGEHIRATGYVGEALREKGFDSYIDILEYEILARQE